MTIAVDMGRKATKTNKQIYLNDQHFCKKISICSQTAGGNVCTSISIRICLDLTLFGLHDMRREVVQFMVGYLDKQESVPVRCSLKC